MVGSSDCDALQFNKWASRSFTEQLLRPENNGLESSLLDRELLKTEVASCFHVPGHYGLLHVTAPDRAVRAISVYGIHFKATLIVIKRQLPSQCAA
jgi:hypothetical protein